jgi:GR25 family glycosyltransferase involved in LPS biosynthesis
MKQFVIVLRDYPKSERFYTEAMKAFQLHGWNVERYDAVDARVFDLEEELQKRNLFISENIKKIDKPIVNPGAQGCFFSHYDLWRKCIELNETIAVFEEDAIAIAPPSMEDFEDVLKMRLGHETQDAILKKTTIFGQFRVGADCYLIKPTGARKLINWCAANGICAPDLLLGDAIVDVKYSTPDLFELHPEANLPGYKNSTTAKRNKDLLDPPTTGTAANKKPTLLNRPAMIGTVKIHKKIK